MIILIIITGLLACTYYAIIIVYAVWFKRLIVFKNLPQKIYEHFSIIIPARNEQNRIEKCLTSVLKNNYPAKYFEVIVVDDFSTDKTVEIVISLQKIFANLRLIKLADEVNDGQLNSYKKKAIETAVDKSNHDWIISTDADCLVDSEWLNTFNSFIQKEQPVFIAAPVKFINNGSFLSIFQCLDFLSLQGITAAAVSSGNFSMCNGANICYKKPVFYEVGKFKNIDSIASGDDMLLMDKIYKKYPHKTKYLFAEQSIVQTMPMLSWKNFFNQRIRWASKATSYNNKNIFVVLLVVYLFNLCLLILPVLSIIYFKVWWYWIAFIALKIIAEIIFLFPVARFYHQSKLLWWFPVMQPFHIFYTVIAGFFGKFGKYSWKGRSVK